MIASSVAAGAWGSLAASGSVAVSLVASVVVSLAGSGTVSAFASGAAASGAAAFVPGIAAFAPGLTDVTIEALPVTDLDRLVSGVVGFTTGFLLVFLLGRFVLEPGIDLLLQRKEAFTERGVRSLVIDAVDLLVILAAVWMGLHAAGLGNLVSATAVIGAAGTIVIGVAAQDALGNLANGVFMAADPDFEVGDWISWDGREGEVVDIGLRATQIRTFSNRIVTVPNGELGTAAITNHTIRTPLHESLDVEIGYEEDIDTVREYLLAEARATDGVLEEPEPSVLTVEYGDSALVLRLAYSIEAESRPDEVGVKSALAERVIERLLAERVELPGPTRELAGELTVETADEGLDRVDVQVESKGDADVSIHDPDQLPDDPNAEPVDVDAEGTADVEIDDG